MKYNTLVVAPIFTRSGYGDFARAISQYLLADGRFSLGFIPTRWGDTPMNATKTPIEEQILAEDRIVKTIDTVPDIMFEFSVPTEFGRLVNVRGKMNIGMTAGIEASVCPPDWIEGVNRQDLVFATSRFAKESLLSQYPRRDGTILKVEKPIEISPIGVDVELFRDSKRVQDLQVRLDAIPENFAFLFVGHWLPGSIGEDRKDVARLVDLFCRTFNGNRKVALIMKTSTGTHSIGDRLEIIRRVNLIRGRYSDAPNVYLVHGDLTDREMSTLYRHVKVKSLVTLTHGEGFMISGLGFSLSGKPMLVPGYSGHLDYLFPNHPVMDVRMTDVPASGLPPGMIGHGAKWGTVTDEVAMNAMNYTFREYPLSLAKHHAQKAHVEKSWSHAAVAERFIGDLNRYLADVPFEEEIILPTVTHSNIEGESHE